jgi:hypothetical protein
MIRRVRLIWGLVGATAVALVAVPSASAATNLGETFNPPSFCAPGTTYITTDSPGDTYLVPFSGVITEWSFQTDSLGPPAAKLKIGRADTDTVLSDTETPLSIVGESGSENLAPNTLNRFSARVSVQQGDFLGIYLGGDQLVHCSDSASLGFQDHFNSSDVPAGTSDTFERENEGQVEVAAVLERDADNDGFGDESQDQCPSNGGTQGPCAPAQPAPKKKCKKHKKKHRSAESAKKKKCGKKKRH